MIIIGITGSIGCGKSTLSDIARGLGCAVWNVDAWVRNLYRQKSFLRLVAELFPEVKLGDGIDKKVLRNIVFNDYLQLKKLENIIHPYLYQKLKRSIRKLIHKNGVVVIDGALIFELGWNRLCQCVIVADAPYEVQKNHVMLRDGISALDFDKINRVQMPNSEKILLADAVVDTNKAKNLLRAELALLLEEIKKW